MERLEEKHEKHRADKRADFRTAFVSGSARLSLCSLRQNVYVSQTETAFQAGVRISPRSLLHLWLFSPLSPSIRPWTPAELSRNITQKQLKLPLASRCNPLGRCRISVSTSCVQRGARRAAPAAHGDGPRAAEAADAMEGACNKDKQSSGCNDFSLLPLSWLPSNSNTRVKLMPHGLQRPQDATAVLARRDELQDRAGGPAGGALSKA